MEATLALVHEKGLSAFTMQEVAKRAGLATGTVYVYFESKEKLLTDTYQWVKKAGLDALIGQLDKNQPYPALMKGLWIRFLKYCLEKEPEMVFVEQFKHSPYLHLIPANIQAEFERPIQALLDLGKQQLLLKDMDNQWLYAVIHGTTLSLSRLIKEEDLTQHPEKIEALFRLVWDSLKA